jgi:hypothetical protein
MDEILLDWFTPTIVYPISMSEIKILRKRTYFHLIYIEAPVLLRYKRFC